MEIPFFKPDITEAEIDEVADTLRSGWITTGPKTKRFEGELTGYCGSSKTICLNSATAALECALRLLGVGPGDEVITSPYTYTASASVISHVGATPVFVDTEKDSLQMDYDRLPNAITDRTKAIIPVDVAGVMCEYDRIFSAVEEARKRFHPASDVQQGLGRVAVIADAAHSLGATYHGRPSGSVADLTAFSFHAVKNLTTGEGGALMWRADDETGQGVLDSDELYRRAQLLSLHGQSKDALAKNEAGSWEYDIEEPAYKWNMTDIAAAIGLAQLERYPAMLARRRTIIKRFRAGINSDVMRLALHYTDEGSSSGHLAIARLTGFSERRRNDFIKAMAAKGVVCNVHYKPLPLLTAYQKLGFSMINYPNAYDYYRNEVTLPLYTLLTDEQVEYIIACVNEAAGECRE